MEFAPELVDAVLVGDVALADAYAIAYTKKTLPTEVPRTITIPTDIDEAIAEIKADFAYFEVVITRTPWRPKSSSSSSSSSSSLSSARALPLRLRSRRRPHERRVR